MCMDTSQMATALSKIMRGNVFTGEPLATYTTMKIGGPACILAVPADIVALQNALRFAAENGLAAYLLGGGSNLLVWDSGVEGLVLRLGEAFLRLDFQGNRVVAGAAVPLPRLVAESIHRGLEGLEALVGIPGTVGGALAMNAGPREADIGSCVHRVKVIGPDLSEGVLSREELSFGYRSSAFQARALIAVEAEIELQEADPAELRARAGTFIEHRRRTQPLEHPSAGSIFKNPPGDAAGRLIDLAGLKGLRRGDAVVSEKHANFIVNLRRARAEDVLNLMIEMHARVLKQFSVSLEPEIKIWGYDETDSLPWATSCQGENPRGVLDGENSDKGGDPASRLG